MAHYSLPKALTRVLRSCRPFQSTDPLMQYLIPRLNRGFAAQAACSISEEVDNLSNIAVQDPVQLHSPPQQVLTTLYAWPDLEPTRHAFYNPLLLNLPLRRDILHRAVVYEGDNTRQGTAHTKWRSEVRGSNRKLYPQKGTGRARVGDKKSPIRRGGGRAFGPRGTGPNKRNYKTDLPRKIYDRAFRTALSYRHSQGELIVIDGKITQRSGTGGRLLNNIFVGNSWGQGNGGAMLVTEAIRGRFFYHMTTIPEHGVVKDLFDVDVKDLLEKGRVIIEKGALDCLLVAHMYDLGLRTSLEHALDQEKGQVVHAQGVLDFTGRPSPLRFAKVSGLLSGLEATEVDELEDELLEDDLFAEDEMVEGNHELEGEDRVHEPIRSQS